jgi:sarcosine oxidase
LRIGVVGVGGSGSAACYYAARLGHEVTGYEQFRLDHENGSSHGASRVIRYTYTDNLYTELMTDAYPLWEALETAAGEDLFVRCGNLMIAPSGHQDLDDIETALIDSQQPFERLAASEVNRRFPAFHLRETESATWQPNGGFLRAARCVLAQARLATTLGATLIENCAVTEISQHGSEVIIRDARGNESVYDRVIVTAGAWMGQLFSALNLPLSVTRQELVYFPGEPTTPNSVRPGLDAATKNNAWEQASLRMPDLSPEVVYSKTCLYTNTPTEDFILDFVPDMPNVFLVSGCSGHGFKFTTLLGKIAVLKATGEDYPRDLSRFQR